jgi:hypothetical protein
VDRSRIPSQRYPGHARNWGHDQRPAYRDPVTDRGQQPSATLAADCAHDHDHDQRQHAGVYFGLAAFKKGHYWMSWIGFFLPFLWIVGALIGPPPRAAGTA